jgi:hypothetical protein
MDTLRLDADAAGREVVAVIKAALAEWLRANANDLAGMAEEQARAILLASVVAMTPLPPRPTTMQEAAEYEAALAERCKKFAALAALELAFGARVTRAKNSALKTIEDLLPVVGSIGLRLLLAAL